MDRSSLALMIQNNLRDVYSVFMELDKVMDKFDTEIDLQFIFEKAVELYDAVKNEYDYTLDENIKKEIETFVDNIQKVIINLKSINKRVKKLSETIAVCKSLADNSAQLVDHLI